MLSMAYGSKNARELVPRMIFLRAVGNQDDQDDQDPPVQDC
jgi:hypothetical protein